MPRKRKVAAVTDEDTDKMPPPARIPMKSKQMASKKNGKTSTLQPLAESQQMNISQKQDIHPVVGLLELAQKNESLHGKYFKELQTIYNNVR